MSKTVEYWQLYTAQPNTGGGREHEHRYSQMLTINESR